MRVYLKNPVVLQLIIAALTFAVYSFALQGEFKTMDDEYCIINNPQIRSFRYLKDVLTSSFFGGNSYYRPLVTVSFMTEYYFYGLNAYYYYLDNIIIHILSALSVFSLMFFISRKRMLAFSIALLFAVHPIQWEAVSNVPGRAILLSAFFAIHAFRFFCVAEFRKSAYLLSGLCLILGLMCKESAGVMPVIMLCYRWLLRMPVKGKRSVFKPVLPFFLINAVYLLVRRHFGVTHLFYWPNWQEALLGLISFLRGVITYFRLFFHPVDLQFDRAQLLFLSFDHPEVRITISFFLTLALLLFVFRQRILPEALFFIAWFVIELIPVSQFIVSIGVQPGYISLAEHFLYSACIGFFTVWALLTERLYEWMLKRKLLTESGFRILVIGVFGYLMILTVQQNIYSGNEISMFKRTLELNPSNLRVRYNLAYVYARRRQYADAEREFRKIVEVTPAVVNARIALGKALCDQRRYWEGLREYERIHDAGKLKHVLEKNIQMTFLVLRHQYEEMLKEDFNNGEAHYALGIVYSKTGKLDLAVAHFQKAALLRPDDPNVLFNLASSLAAQGDFQQAREVLEKLFPLLTEDDVLYSHALTLQENISQK